MGNGRLCAVIISILVALSLLNAASLRAQTPAWPHTLTLDGASVVVYQPQAIEWPSHETLTTREAIAITLPGEKSPVLGTTEISFSTHTDAATDEVILTDPQLIASHFPALDTGQAARLEARIRNALPGIRARPVSLQTVLLSLKQTAKPDNVAVDNTPPVIFYSARPAILVMFDGEPVMAPIGQTGLTFAVNTNWDVFSEGRHWYLLAHGTWLAADAYTGPYVPVTKLPAAFSTIPADENFAAVRKAIPPPHNSTIAPAVFVSTRPSEIIITDGPPQFVPVSGTGLQVVRNTHNTLFFQPSDGKFFLLTSGRWFASHGLDGPWRFASNDLPPDFGLIPPNGPQGAVLASVPGTSQAQLAVLQAQVPRQATLKKDSAKLNVVYAGPPQFKPIPGAPMTYAVNTSYEVIGTAGAYYVCYQGAWFTGPSPMGPWVLATSVPPVIYTVPPSSPLYNVTYVKVYGATPAAVTYGYTAGYLMGFVSAGVMVYGTGYYYPPVVLPGRVPIYYSYPMSYVGNLAYNPATGTWARGGTVYGRYGSVATGGAYYNPGTGAYGRAGTAYGPYGEARGFSYYNPSTGGYARGGTTWNAGGGYAQGSYYNPRTGVSGSTTQNANPYARWGSSTFAGPNQTVRTESGSNARGSAGAFTSTTGAEGAAYRGAGGNSGGAIRTQNGDVYAGHDGNAYQHTSNGWSKWSNGGWQPVTPPAGTSSATRQQAPGGTAGQAQNRTAPGQRAGRQSIDSSSYQQLERDRQARFAGNQQRLGETGMGGRFGGREGGGFRFRR
ncbi:hypothetical protein [Rhodopila globiformis]|uniref:hypothetical protein n=1 Tax=Rhodopila globiformis TaxID=1071 RepID=UPI0011AFDF42|nr:hypothetical protein [Rhodopila globiformis]